VREGRAGSVAFGEGETFFEVRGTARRSTVVLVPGIVGPHQVWDQTVPALVAGGHRVVRYDLYGRGRSSARGGDYGLDRFCGQLSGLLEALQIEGSVDLIGLSMGGAVVAGFADRFPERVRRLVFVAPAGVRRSLPAPVRLARVRGVGERIWRAFGPRLVRLGLRRSFRQSGTQEAFVALLEEQARRPAFQRAFLSTIRHMPLTNAEEVYRRVGARRHPTLIVWGMADRIAPPSGLRTLLSWMPGARGVGLDGAAHTCCLDEPERVNPLLTRFLGEPDPAGGEVPGGVPGEAPGGALGGTGEEL